MAYLFLRLHGFGVAVNQVFWGLWLFPLGLLIWRSGFLPRFLGVLMFVNGAAYLTQAVVDILWPLQSATVSGWLFPALMGELFVMLWLLIRGTKRREIHMDDAKTVGRIVGALFLSKLFAGPVENFVLMGPVVAKPDGFWSTPPRTR